MFSPEMMQAAQGMMANMKPEDMERMSQFAANMDPNTMESMMKNMGGSVPAGMDAKQMCDQMKNMSPEQMKAGMSQAQSQMGAQKQYVYNGALHLKNEGNTHIKNEEYSKALESYNRGIENLRPHAGDDVNTLKLQLLSNAALCHLKENNFKNAIGTCEEALRVDPKAVKPTFRRGLAHEGLGDLSKALSDVKLAASLSPEDKAISSDLKRLRQLCTDKGIKEEEIKQPARPPEASAGPKSFSPGGSSSSSATPGSGNMSEALDAVSKNPDMLEHATNMMSNMSEEDIKRMMPGADPAFVKSRLQNKDQLKTAMDSLKAMPEEDRKKLLEQGASAHAEGKIPDMSQMSSVFENPDMMKQVAEMAKSQDGVDSEQADMMRKAAEELQKNPELGKQMSEMMKNIPPEQMQKMMEMSSKMRGGGGKDAGGGNPMANLDSADAMDNFMNNPEMMKAAEDMMKSMSPETLSAMAKSSGVDLDENKAAMIGKMMPYLPYLMKCMRVFSYLRKGWKAMWSPKGRIVTAVVVLSLAVLQHYRSS
jgi:hypothetical protein